MPTNSLSHGNCWDARSAAANRPHRLQIVCKTASQCLSETDPDVQPTSTWAQARELRRQLLAADEASPSGWAALLLWHPQDGNFIGLTSRMDNIESHIWQSIRGEERYEAKDLDSSKMRPCLPDVPVAIAHMYADGFVTEWLMEPIISSGFIADSKVRKRFAACIKKLRKEK